MSTASLLQRITLDPAICHGQPCVRGLRYPVTFLLELMSGGISHEEILVDYEDLFAALAYGSRLADVRQVASVP